MRALAIVTLVALLAGCSGDLANVPNGCDVGGAANDAGSGGAASEAGASGSGSAGAQGLPDAGATQRTTEELCGSVDFPVIVQLSHPEFMAGCLQRKPNGQEWCCPQPQLPDVGTCGDGFTTGNEECDGQRFCNPNCKWMADAEVVRCGGPIFAYTYNFSVPQHMNNCVQSTTGGFGWCCRYEEQPD